MRVIRPYCRRMQGLLARGLFLRYCPCSQLFGFWGKFLLFPFGFCMCCSGAWGVVGVGGSISPLCRWPLLCKHQGRLFVVAACRVAMDTSYGAVRFPAPPTSRHQRPSSSIGDEFRKESFAQ